jgi:membrane protein DedA with SNARE-associated domain
MREASIGGFVDLVLSFINAHQEWALPIVFILAFGESLAFVSLLLPATAILLATGGLIGAAGLSFWPIWTAAALGAILGDWVSYWFGIRYQREIAGLWPLSRYPGMLDRGEALFQRWGAIGVFVGRFFGPLRCVMPLVAGICAMRMLPFQIANNSSGLVWATGILAPGKFGMEWLM